MARGFRVESPGIYHVLNRGVEKRDVFLERSDYVKFLRLLKENKEEFDFRVLAYCLMPNHYHLLLETKYENLSAVLKSLNQNFAQYFNRKYERVGGLWQGRFKSRCVRDNKYLKTLVKYIEQNPIKAGIASKPGEYPWVSALTKDITLSPEENALLEEFFGAEKSEKDREGLSPATTLSQHFLEADLLKASIGLWRGNDSRLAIGPPIASRERQSNPFRIARRLQRKANFVLSWSIALGDIKTFAVNSWGQTPQVDRCGA